LSGDIKGSGLIDGSVYSSSNEDFTSGKGKTEAEVDQIVSENVAKYKKIALDREAEGLIDPTSNLDGTPVFVHSGMKDEIVPPINQKIQAGLLEEFNANLNHMFDPDMGHFFGEDVPRQIITYIYENLPNSGINSGGASKGKADDWRDAKHGVFNAFLQ
jgi:hypothetical protein